MANKMTYANITIGELIGTYRWATFNPGFEGFVCDADSQAVAVVFNS